MPYMWHTCHRYFRFFKVIRIFVLLNRILFNMFQQIPMTLSQQQTSLVELMCYHDEHSSLSKYLRARVALMVCFTSIVLI